MDTLQQSYIFYTFSFCLKWPKPQARIKDYTGSLLDHLRLIFSHTIPILLLVSLYKYSLTHSPHCHSRKTQWQEMENGDDWPEQSRSKVGQLNRQQRQSNDANFKIMVVDAAESNNCRPNQNIWSYEVKCLKTTLKKRLSLLWLMS